MSTWFVSRHPGAVDWVRAQGLPIDFQVDHLEPSEVEAGDTVIGSLPVNLVAIICARGARYLHLTLDLPPSLRGQELSCDDLIRLQAQLQAFRVVTED